MAGLKELIVKIGADTRDLEKGIDTAAGKLSSLGDKATSIGSSLSMGVTAPIAAMGTGILYVSGQFEAAMNKMQGISGVTGDAFEGLRNKAKELGATTSFSASEAAQGMIALSQAGLSADQVMAGIEGTLKLAAAGGLELGEASGIAANAMAQFGLDASQVDRVANAMAATASNSTTNIQELAMGLKFGGLAAASAGMSFEQTGAALGILANKGMAGSTSGERLRTVLGALAKPSKIAAEALDEAGVAVASVNVEARGLPAVLETLKNANLSTSQAIEIFGIEAKDAAQALIDAGAGGFTQFADKLTGTQAATDQAAANMKGFEGAMKELGSAVEGLAIAIADSGLLEWASGLVKQFTEVVRSVSTTSPELLRIGVVIAGVAAAVGPVIFALGTFASSWAALTPVIASAGAMLSGLPAMVAGIPAAFSGIAAGAVAAKGAILGLGVTAATVAGGAAAAFAAWHLGKWAADNIPLVSALGDAMADLLMQAADLAGLDLTGQKTAMGDLAKQANALSADLAAQGVVVARNGKTLQDWNKHLMAAAAELVEAKKAAGDYGKASETAATSTAKLGTETKAIVAEMKASATAAGTAEDGVFDLEAAIKANNAATKEMERIAKAAAEALAKDMGGAAVDLKVDVEAVTVATQTAMNSIAGWTQTAADQWNAAAAQAATTAASVDAAFKAMGVSTKAELDQAAIDAENNFNLIRDSGQASADAIDEAWAKMLQARKEALVANGSDLGTEEQQILDNLLERQRGHVAESKTIWQTWADNIENLANDLDIGGKIFAGDFAPSKIKGTLADIGKSFMDALAQPAVSAINSLIDQGINILMGSLDGLIGKISGVGGAWSGVFGGGSSAAGGVGSVGGSVGGGGGAGGSAAGAAGSGVMNTIGAVSSGIGAVSSIVGNFQSARMETSLNAIELETRQLKDLVRDQVLPDLWFKSDMMQWGPGVKASESAAAEVAGLRSELMAFMARLEQALGRPISVQIDGRELAIAVGENQEALGVTA